MKKNKVLTKILIAVLLLIVSVIVTFAELGVAMTFNLTFKGMTYVEYLVNFYNTPWHVMAAAIVVAVFLFFGTEILYNEIKECKKN